MDTKRFLAIALITVSSGSTLARAGRVDCPRPDLWERYPRIKQQIQSPPTDRDDDQVFYSNDIGWFDSWIPMSPSLKKEPPNGKYMRTWRQGTVPLESAARPRTGTPPTTQPKAIAALADVLAGAPASRVTAAAALGELGAEHKSAVRPLLRALNDPDPSVRVAAAQALDHIRWQLHQIRPNLNGDELWPSNSEFVPPLVGLLADKNGAVRHAAIFCLIRIGPPARAAMQPLVSLYWFGTAQDRADALSALESIYPNDRASVAVFLDAAKSSDVSMRVFAAAAMSHVKVDPAGRGIVRALAGALADEAWNVRVQAAYGLELLGPAAKAAVPALKVATDDPDERVRQHAAHALEVIERNHPKMPQPSPPRRGRRHYRAGR